MSNLDIFHNPTKKLPTSDEQIVRVGMDEIEIQGRKSALPGAHKAPELAISHIPNAGSSR